MKGLLISQGTGVPTVVQVGRDMPSMHMFQRSHMVPRPVLVTGSLQELHLQDQEVLLDQKQEAGGHQEIH